MPDSLAGIDNPSHYILNNYALDAHRYSSTKERILKKNLSLFMDLPEILKRDIEAHYKKASVKNCRDVIWSNEGLYLLDSVDEYKRLYDLFSIYSKEIVCICCLRDVDSYRDSYTRHLKKIGRQLSRDKGSYRYVEKDSWLFDYDRKKTLLQKVFGKSVIYLDYNEEDMVSEFMNGIGYSTIDGRSIRLNIT